MQSSGNDRHIFEHGMKTVHVLCVFKVPVSLDDGHVERLGRAEVRDGFIEVYDEIGSHWGIFNWLMVRSETMDALSLALQMHGCRKRFSCRVISSSRSCRCTRFCRG